MGESDAKLGAVVRLIPVPVVLLACGACTPAAPHPQAAPPMATASSAVTAQTPAVVTAPAATLSEVPPPPPPPTLSPLATEAASGEPRVRILSPRSEQVLSERTAASLPVRINDFGFRNQRARGRRIALVLDDFRVRYLDAGQSRLTLRELVPADRDLAAGAHELIAALVSENGYLIQEVAAGEPVAVTRFWVGQTVAEPAAPVRPRLVYVEPQGTFNGPEAAAGARLDYLVLGAEETAEVRVTISGDDGSQGSTVLKAGGPQRIEGLASGDYKFDLELLPSTAGTPETSLAAAGRTITVNLDAPVAE